MKTKIMLMGLSFDKPEMVERFDGTQVELKARLIELQEGYCEDEKPRIHIFKVGDKKLIEAVSDSDYSYVAKWE